MTEGGNEPRLVVGVSGIERSMILLYRGDWRTKRVHLHVVFAGQFLLAERLLRCLHRILKGKHMLEFRIIRLIFHLDAYICKLIHQRVTAWCSYIWNIVTH